MVKLKGLEGGLVADLGLEGSLSVITGMQQERVLVREPEPRGRTQEWKA